MKNKRLSSIALLLTVTLIAAAFVGCNSGSHGDNTESSDPNGTTESETVEETVEETKAPDYSSMKCVARERITNNKMGIRAMTVKNSDPMIVKAEVSKYYVALYGYNSGSAVLEITDYFGFTAKATVTVDAENEKISYTVEECKSDFIEVGLDFKAQGNGSTDDTKAFQNAVDSAKPGETVYVYPGRYNVSLIVMREGVTLRMYTTMTDAKVGFTEKIASDFNRGKIAVLSGTRIQNVEHAKPGAGGCSNFSIIGGAIDNNLTTRSTLLFGCAKNVKVENVIFKDIKGNHTIQITGSTDTVINNCMFAGYLCGDVFTREIIQVEPSTPGASGGPITFGAGEYNLPENITVSNCYFGKSDEAGAPLIAIGHHSQVGGANVTGFKITDNVFDECLYAAIRYSNIVDVEITGNTFISTSKYMNATQFKEAKTPAFILFYHYTNAATYTTDESGVKVTRAAANEQAGFHNIKIENNTFNIDKGSDKRIMHYEKNGTTPGATYVQATMQYEYKGPIYEFSGYKVNNNYASDISFSNNVINIKGQTTYKNFYMNLGSIYDLTFENNKVTLANGVSFSSNLNGFEKGQYISTMNPQLERRFYITAKPSERTIKFVCNGKEYVVIASFMGTLSCDIPEGGTYEMSSDSKGNLTVTLKADNGYRLDSIVTSDGTKLVEGKNNLSSGTTLSINFTK